MSATGTAEPAVQNDPRAPLMAVIAFLNQNITIACIFGAFSVLLSAVQSRLGVGPALSTLGVPVLALVTALMSPVVGMLAARFSLRLVLLVGAALNVAGYVLLAASSAFPLYLIAYGALLGPGMAVAVIVPATLVTRWFVVHRGRALGLITAPVMMSLMPLVATWMVQSHGLTMTYAMLAALSAVSLVANVFVVDHPPGAADLTSQQEGAARAGGNAMADVLKSPTFWSFALAFAASGAGSVIIAAHMAPMALSWGFSAGLAAVLLSIQAFIGIAGNILFGWLADRLGGVRALALVVLDTAVLWLLLLLHLPFAPTAVIVGLIGLHGAGALPALSVALGEAFGQENFSGAFGMANLINLPFSVLCVPAAALIYARTGSYNGAIVGQAAFLALAGLLVLAVGLKGLRAAASARTKAAAAGVQPPALDASVGGRAPRLPRTPD